MKSSRKQNHRRIKENSKKNHVFYFIFLSSGGSSPRVLLPSVQYVITDSFLIQHHLFYYILYKIHASKTREDSFGFSFGLLYLNINLFTYINIYKSVHLSIYLFIHTAISLSTSMYLSMQPSLISLYLGTHPST